MGEIVFLLSGLLTYLIMTNEEVRDSLQLKWKHELRRAIECIFLNIIVLIAVLRFLSGNSESFVNGRINPSFISLKYLIVIIAVSYMNGLLLKFIKKSISIKISKERIISKDDE
ncbi:hypothetical protein [Proteiniclasticum ruminis]|uniref:hypothetical protein n=1 Tax=Proteiniclasticum ruminis TaxID=398199 RepID=UPI0028B22804|nr:hypothetical protein [Proteiniclasticum ruminis]